MLSTVSSCFNAQQSWWLFLKDAPAQRSWEVHVFSNEKNGEIELAFVYELLGRRGRQCHHCPCMRPCLLVGSCFPSSVLLGQSMMEKRYTRSCTFSPKNLPVLHRGVQASPLSPGVKPRHAKIKVQAFLLGFSILSFGHSGRC